MTIIVACIRGGDGSDTVDNGTLRPTASLLRETNYASLTTKCLTVPRSVYGTNTRPTTERTSAFLFSTTRAQSLGESYPFVQYCLYSIRYNVGVVRREIKSRQL